VKSIPLVVAVWICCLLSDAGLVKQNGEARWMVLQGAVSLNGEKIVCDKPAVALSGELIFPFGKRRFAKVATP